MKNKKYIDYHEIHENDVIQDFKNDVLNGLSKKHKTLSNKYINDDLGNKLLQEISTLPEYYLNDCETEIIQNNEDFFSIFFNEQQINIIELGPSDKEKTKILLKHLQNHNIDFQYIPIDVSSKTIDSLLTSMEKDFDTIKTNGLVADYFQGLQYISKRLKDPKVVLLLGSNIGNMNRTQIDDFLRKLWIMLDNNDYLLIGFDLKKDIDTIMNAYNDSKQITEQFHKNVLHRINKKIGGNFKPDLFQYYCTFNPKESALESYLISSTDQDIFVKGIDTRFSFEKGEAIHTESSYKFSESDIEEIATTNGFKIVKNLFDEKHYFVDSLWQVNKGD